MWNDLEVGSDLLMAQESGVSAAKIRSEQIAETLQAAPTEMTEWNDAVIRQLVSEIRMLGTDKLEIILKSGARFEQAMR